MASRPRARSQSLQELQILILLRTCRNMALIYSAFIWPKIWITGLAPFFFFFFTPAAIKSTLNLALLQMSGGLT